MLAAALAAGALPVAAAQAHVSVHPNVLPAGSFPTLNVRVPNEETNQDTVKVAVKMPPGVLSVSPIPPPGWKVTLKTQKLAKPIKTDDGTVTEQVSEVDMTGGRIKPGQTQLFPLAMSVPGKAGDVLTFKAVQTYSGGKVVRWIGPPSADTPAPTADVVKADAPILDVSGDAGPPAALTAAESGGSSAPAQAATTSTSSDGASKGLAITGVVLGALALLLAAAAFVTSRRRALERV
jgi:periplasmic copper chaperone A